MEWSALRCRALRFNAVHSASQCSTVQCSDVVCSAVKCSTVQSRSIEGRAMHSRPRQCSTVQCSAEQTSVLEHIAHFTTLEPPGWYRRCPPRRRSWRSKHIWAPHCTVLHHTRMNGGWSYLGQKNFMGPIQLLFRFYFKYSGKTETWFLLSLAPTAIT